MLESVKAFRKYIKPYHLGDTAAGVTFWGFVSLFPAILAVVSLLGTMETFIGDSAATKARATIIRAANDLLSSGQATSLRSNILDMLTNARSGVAIVATLGAFWSMSKGFAGLCRALAKVMRSGENRSGLKGRAIGLGLGAATTVVVLVVLFQVVLGPLFGLESHIPRGGGRTILAIWQWVRWPFMLAVLIGWTSVMIKWGSGTKIALREVLPGAVVAAVWWSLVTGLFQLGIVLGVLRANPILGAIGGITLTLAWMNQMSFGILLGGAAVEFRGQRNLNVATSNDESSIDNDELVSGTI